MLRKFLPTRLQNQVSFIQRLLFGWRCFLSCCFGGLVLNLVLNVFLCFISILFALFIDFLGRLDCVCFDLRLLNLWSLLLIIGLSVQFGGVLLDTLAFFSACWFFFRYWCSLLHNYSFGYNDGL